MRFCEGLVYRRTDLLRALMYDKVWDIASPALIHARSQSQVYRYTKPRSTKNSVISWQRNSIGKTWILLKQYTIYRPIYIAYRCVYASPTITIYQQCCVSDMHYHAILACLLSIFRIFFESFIGELRPVVLRTFLLSLTDFDVFSPLFSFFYYKKGKKLKDQTDHPCSKATGLLHGWSVWSLSDGPGNVHEVVFCLRNER
jgi:hypothetical protein